MSTLPRPTGKELVRALERVGFSTVRVRGSHRFLRHPDGRATVVPLRVRTLGLGLLRKILADCAIPLDRLKDML
ncbi:MAG: addiction module toxin, HicA family [Acidobacteria bacterium]|nr:addiction module toxin, HicA family [Acidobacteriota bacterium]